MRLHILFAAIVMIFLTQAVFAFDLDSHSGRTSTEINAELEKLKTMPLPELDDYYQKEILAQPYAKETEIVTFVKERLIAENLKLDTFQGYLRASQLSENPSYVLEHQNLAKTLEDKKSVERTIVVYADPNQFFVSDFKLSKQGNITKNHIEHLGVLAEYSNEDKQEIAGVLSVAPTKKASTLLFLGTYRLSVEINYHLPSRYTRTSKVLGNEDKTLDYTETKIVTIDVAPPTLSAHSDVNFGAVVGMIKHGTMGGVEERKAINAPSFTTKILKVEAQ